MLSSTVYYSDFVAAVLFTGLISAWWLTDASVGTRIDIIPVVRVSNACSTLVEFFADVSTYEIFNESVNFY